MAKNERPPPCQVKLLMRDLTSRSWIYAKGFGFLFAGLLAAGCIWLEHPEWRLLMLVAICVWSFARFYYFAFYVIQNYTDDSYRFSGLGSFVLYWLKAGWRKAN